MQNGMSLQDLLVEVQRQNNEKEDFIANTADDVRMVPPAPFLGESGDPRLVLLREGSTELRRFEIDENAHRQIAARLSVPWKFYGRLLTDHQDMVIDTANKLFEREPSSRMIRVLDGRVRAFMSDRYARFDNADVLQGALPAIIKGPLAAETTLLASNVSTDYMYLKILFTDDRLAIDLGERKDTRGNGWGAVGEEVDLGADHQVIARRDAGRDIVRPYVVLRNSEVGKGSLSVSGGFFRSFCLNGCIWGADEAFNFGRTHLGAAQKGGADFQIFSDDSRRKQDELVICEVVDALKAMANPANVEPMARRLRELQNTKPVENAQPAVEAVAKLVDLAEAETASVLESFIRDQDYTQWGMVNAVTEVANSGAVSFDRAQEIERVGAKLIQLPATQWERIAEAELVAA